MVVVLQNVHCEAVRDSEYFTNELSNALACHWQVHHSHVEVTAVVCGAVGNMVGNASSTAQASVTVLQAANETGADSLQPNGTFSDAFAGILADGNSPGTVIDVAAAPTPVPTPAPTSDGDSGTPVGVILGAVFGGLAAAALVGKWAIKKRRQAAAQANGLGYDGPGRLLPIPSGPLII